MAFIRAAACAMALFVTTTFSPASSAADDALTDKAIQLAQHGIVEFVAAHEEDPFEISDDCPIASEEAMRTLMHSQGYLPNVTGWAPNLEWELDHPTIECGPAMFDPERPDPDAPHTAFVIAMELDGSELRFRDLVEAHGAAIVVKNVEGIGGEIAIACSDTGFGACVADWHRDGLRISFGIVGPSEDINQDTTIEMLIRLVPPAVESLANAARE